ncbi:MAG TPA: L,D-transpeptidase family protein [Acidimicrobiales bacterium]
MALGNLARRCAAPVVLAAALAVGLAACGNGSSSSADTAPTTAVTSTSAGGASTTAGPATTAAGATSTTAATSTTTSSTTSTTTTTTTSSPVPTTAPLAAEPPGNLQSGSKGSRTLALQQALKGMGYDPGTPDGSYGLKTEQAIWAFEALHNVPQDGVVTPGMEALILAKPAQTMLRPALGASHTEVDLTRQVLLVWRDNKVALITHVSSGTGRHYCDRNKDDGSINCGDAITPTGVFHYQRRITGWRKSKLGLLWNPVYFNGGIAVHGEPSVPLNPASHGCVRIPMHIGDYFPSLVANGDTIEVFRS